MNLPPIEYFYGRTPLRVWISKCKPFEPKGKEESRIMIETIGLELSPRYKMYLAELERAEADLRRRMNEYFGLNRIINENKNS